MNQKERDIMTLQEMAEFLKLGDKTVLKLVNSGEIPAARVGNQWRFSRIIIEDWLSRRMQQASLDDATRVLSSAKKIIPLSSMVPPELIIMDMKAETREEALKELLLPAVENGLFQNERDIYHLLLRREEMMSTGIVPGIAFPHPRDPGAWNGAEPRIIIGRSMKGVAFLAPDGSPTNLFFMLFSGNDVSHLRIMAKLSLLSKNQNKIQQILAVREAEQIRDVLKTTDCEIAMYL